MPLPEFKPSFKIRNLHIMHAIAIPQDIPQEGLDRILFSTVMKNTNRNYYSQGIEARIPVRCPNLLGVLFV
jgi:hypothetical protein